MRKKCLIVVCFIISIYGNCCLNESRIVTNSKGKSTFIQEEVNMILIPGINSFDKKDIEQSKKMYWEFYQKSKSLEDYSDYAMQLIYLGEYQKAINIYLEIEKKNPNLYYVASNIGTAYELVGENQKALDWIKKSVKLNPDSHGGSEWVHIKILEDKLGLNKNSSILGLNFGSEIIPISTNSKLKPNDILHHLRHQLEERTQFVKPEDKYVAEMFFEYGNLLALEENIELAVQAYELAQKYGYKSTILDKRLDDFKVKIKNNKESGKIIEETQNFEIAKFEKEVNEQEKGNFNLVYGGIFLFLIIALITVLFIIKRKK